jgi:hypothetical protein
MPLALLAVWPIPAVHTWHVAKSDNTWRFVPFCWLASREMLGLWGATLSTTRLNPYSATNN